MAKVHFLTVGKGDCTIIQHDSGRVTVVDICGGNKLYTRQGVLSLEALENVRGNFRMCERLTDPIDYLCELGERTVFRFILSHPDMDHLDGFNELVKHFEVTNFWDSGARKDKPDFEGGPYNEVDWNRYVSVRDGKDEEDIEVVTPLAASTFDFANKDEQEPGDDLHIVSPDRELIDHANDTQEFNDASYIISYMSPGGKIILPGDAHDKSWNYAIQNHKDKIKNCAFLLAPHHGRDSDANHEYLDTLRPTYSLFGCASSKYLAYDAWKNRGLPRFTQNQAGNVVLEIYPDLIEIYIENKKFVELNHGNISKTNQQGYYLFRKIINQRKLYKSVS